MKKILLLVALLVASQSAISSPTDLPDQASQTAKTKRVSTPIEGSYIVTLDKDSPNVLAWFDNIPTKFDRPTKQSQAIRDSFGARLQLMNATVENVYPSIYALHVSMDADEAEQLRTHPDVLNVEQERTATLQGTQELPGWGLDRSDYAGGDPLHGLNNSYSWSGDGSGVTVYSIDSGANTTLSEFGGRVTNFYDANGGIGNDCVGHGNYVADAIGGAAYGIAKNVTIKSVKVTDGCTMSATDSNIITVFDWAAANLPAGTILSSTLTYESGSCNNPIVVTGVENAFKAAYNKGLIIVQAAGNDGCDVGSFTPTRLSQVLNVGAMFSKRGQIIWGWGSPIFDMRGAFSRTGNELDMYAPGVEVALQGPDGVVRGVSGTSYAAAYTAGMFAIGCQLYPSACTGGTANAYSNFKSVMRVGNEGTGTEWMYDVDEITHISPSVRLTQIW